MSYIFQLPLNDNDAITHVIKTLWSFKKFLITKGSVSVNGISLTINNIKNNMFRVDIIPHTFNKTNLNKLKKNSTVNIEYDLLIKFLKQNVK